MIGLSRCGTIPMLVLLVGCGPTTEDIREREELVILKHAKGLVGNADLELVKLIVLGTREQLKDPASAQFRNLSIAGIEDNDGDLVGGVLCGELNARNSMGGYVGFRPFYTDHMHGQFKLYVMNEDDRTEQFMSAYRMYCDKTRSVPTP